VADQETFGRRVGARIASDRLAESLSRLFARYKSDKHGAETFQEYCLRHSNEQLVGYLSANPTANETSALHGAAGLTSPA
jgi:sulfite reductase beta subunit-like hemoprotein